MNKAHSLQEVAAQAVQLSLADRLQLLDIIHQSLAPATPPPAHSLSLLAWRGFLKSDAPSPTDDDLRNAYTDYLIEKYA